MTWPWIPLGKVIHLQVEEVAVDPTETYSTVGVYSFGRGLFDRPPVAGSGSSYKKFFRLQKDQFVLSLLFGWEGALSRVTEEHIGKVVSPYFPTFACAPEKLLVEYLDWFAKMPVVWSALKNQAIGLGDRRRTLKPEHLLNVSIPLPPLDEQRRIVARLDAVAALVEDRQRLLAATDRDLDAILRKAFEKVTDGADMLPMEKVAPLVRRPVDVHPDKRYPELGVRSFGRGTFNKAALEGTAVGSKRLYRIAARDLVFNIVFAWEGAVAIVKNEDDGRVGSHRFLTCVPDPAIATVDFLVYFFLTPEGLRNLGEASPGGAGRNRTLGLKKLAAIEVPVPPIEKQRWFDHLQARARAVRQAHVETAKDLDALTPAMLHEVFACESRRVGM